MQHSLNPSNVSHAYNTNLATNDTPSDNFDMRTTVSNQQVVINPVKKNHHPTQTSQNESAIITSSPKDRIPDTDKKLNEKSTYLTDVPDSQKQPEEEAEKGDIDWYIARDHLEKTLGYVDQNAIKMYLAAQQSKQNSETKKELAKNKLPSGDSIEERSVNETESFEEHLRNCRRCALIFLFADNDMYAIDEEIDTDDENSKEALSDNASDLIQEEEERQCSEFEQIKELGNTFYKLKNYDEAIQMYTACLSMTKITKEERGVICSNRSSAYLKEGLFELAVHDAKNCISFCPKWFRGYQRAADILFHLEYFEKAEKYYGKAWELNNESIEVAEKLLILKNLIIADKDKDEAEDCKNSVSDNYALSKKIFTFPRKLKKLFSMNTKRQQKKKKDKILTNLTAMAAFVDTVIPVLDEYGPLFLPKFHQLRLIFPVKLVSYVKNTQQLRRKLAFDEESFKDMAFKHFTYGLKEAKAVKAFSKCCKKVNISATEKEYLKFLFFSSINYSLTVNDIIAIFRNGPENDLSGAVFSKLENLIASLRYGGKRFTFEDSSTSSLDLSADDSNAKDISGDVANDKEEKTEEDIEDDFDAHICLPTSKITGFYTKTANLLLDRSAYTQILRNAAENERVVCSGNKEEHPKGGTLLVANIKFIQDKVHPPLSTRNAEIESRTDGYRWGLNQGSQHAESSTISFWLSRNPAFPEDPKQHVNFRKVFFKHKAFPELAIVHYVGNDDIALKDYKHGNSKNSSRAYKPALKSVLAEEQKLSETIKPLGVYNKVSQAALQKDNPAQAMPRNYDQVYNAAKTQRQKQRISPFTLFNAIALSKHLRFEKDEWKSHPHFITDIRIAQNSVSVHIMFTPMMKEMLEVMKSYPGVMVMYYDPTYDVGDYFVSCLSWYHPFFGRHEIVAMHIHTTRHGVLHKDFIEAVGNHFGLSSLSRVFLIITDMEFTFKNLWPNLRHLYCSLHLNRNLTDKLEKLLVDNGYAIADLNKIFKALKTIPSYKEFDKKLEAEIAQHKRMFETEDAIIEVFKKYCKKLREKASIPALLAIVGEETDINIAISVTSNPGETINDLFKEHMPNRRELLLDELICLSFNVAAFQYNEVQRGYHQSGNLQLKQKYQQLEKPASKLDYSKLLVIPNIVQLVDRISKGENMDDHGSNLASVFCVETMLDNYQISSNELNQHIVNVKGEAPAMVIPSTKKNSGGKYECTCKATGNCIHILAVLKHLNDSSYLNANETCGDPLREDRRVNNYSRSGRKRPRPEDYAGASVDKEDDAIQRKSKNKITLDNKPNLEEQKALELLMDIRNDLQLRSREAYSLYAIPSKSYDPGESEAWFFTVIKDKCITNRIIFHSFQHPLPVLQHKEVIICVNKHDGIQVVTRVNNEIHAVLLHAVDEDPSSTSNLLGMCGRDLSKVKVKMVKHDHKATATIRDKLIIAASLISFAGNGEDILSKKVVPVRVKNANSETVKSAMDSVKTIKNTVTETSVKFYCCCKRSYVQNESEMIQCSKCKSWSFMSCYGGSGIFKKDWCCCECMKDLQLYIKWGKAPYENTCTLDNFLMALYLNNATGIIVKALENLEIPSYFEQTLLTFLNACRLARSNKELLEAKYLFIEANYDTTNLWGSEDKVWNEELVFSQYGVQCEYNCNCGSTFSHPKPFDFLTIENLSGISELVQIQTSFSVTRTCKLCGDIVPPSLIRYMTEKPFIIAIRLASPHLNANISFKDLENLPLSLLINEQNYRLSSISFHEAGHYVSIIFCDKYNVIFYDGMHGATPMTFRSAIQKIQHISVYVALKFLHIEIEDNFFFFILSHGYENDVNVSIAHRHFDLDDNEVMLETSDGDARIAKPVAFEMICLYNAQPALLACGKNGEWYPVGYGIESLSPAWKDSAFLKNVAGYLIKHNLQDKLLLGTRNVGNERKDGFQYLEMNYGATRTSEIRLVEEKDLKNAIKTTYGFKYGPGGIVELKCNDYCGCEDC